MEPGNTPLLTRRSMVLSGGGAVLALTLWPYRTASAATAGREGEAIYAALVEAVNSAPAARGIATQTGPGSLNAYLTGADEDSRARVASLLAAVDEEAAGRFASLSVAERLDVLRRATSVPSEGDLRAAIRASMVISAIALVSAAATIQPEREAMGVHLVPIKVG